MMAPANPNAEKRAASFLAIADFLIPAYRSMPVFSAVCSVQDATDALGFRPDLKEAFYRGLDEGDFAAGAEPGLEALEAGDGEAFDAVTTLAITTYYMNPEVRALIGYPGQENLTYDAFATQSYLTDGSLGKVIARGRKYRPTPGAS